MIHGRKPSAEPDDPPADPLGKALGMCRRSFAFAGFFSLFDNLLVLAGSVVRTRSNAPVPIADVFRAATSEMEQYERVRLQPVSGAAVAGPAAGGLIHLLAELLDNAAMYSPPTSPILMAAAFTPDGGLRLEITDSGVGIPGSELAELNTRLASPGSFDMQVPSRMGRHDVGRGRCGLADGCCRPRRREHREDGQPVPQAPPRERPGHRSRSQQNYHNADDQRILWMRDSGTDD